MLKSISMKRDRYIVIRNPVFTVVTQQISFIARSNP